MEVYLVNKIEVIIDFVENVYMKKKTLTTIGIILAFAFAVVFCVNLFLSALSGVGNPTGGNNSPDYPYFITTKEMKIKNIMIPKGTKLTYEEHLFKEGEQDKLLDENKLTDIELPEGETINWGGVPVYWISKFFNSEMKGYSVYADFSKLKNDTKTKFSELWKSCNDDLGVLVKNTDDWSFNVNNIEDVASCGVNNQRFFKENREQQKFLDELRDEMKKSNR